jgi:hypothetical protein
MNLRDEVGEDETHPLAALIEAIGTLKQKNTWANARVDGGVVPNRLGKTVGKFGVSVLEECQ